MLRRLLTKNYTQVPLLWVAFNYKNNGKDGSCMLNIHPVLANDKELKSKLNEIVDYIREKYDMEKII